VAEVRPISVEQTAILKQLESMLGHHTFKNSKRCTALLRYLVEKAIDNPEVHFKERTLGIDVFSREASYDTAIDPIVRMTASEIRKRIAQYYHEANHENELRIELPAGSYSPEFRSIPQPVAQPLQAEAVQDSSPLTNAGRSPAKRSLGSFLRSRRLLYGAAAAIAVLLILAGAVNYRIATSNFARFWSPIMNSPNRVLICIGTGQMPDVGQSSGSSQNQGGGSATAAPGRNLPDQTPPSQAASTNDVNAISRVVGVLEHGRKTYEVRAAETSTLDNLRAGPVILVGFANNGWTRRLTSSLRFHMEDDRAAERIKVVDSDDPKRVDWFVNMYENVENLKKDYAIVSRYSDEVTGTPVLEVAGMRNYGTTAAAEFVSNPRYLNSLGQSLSGCNRNIQFVVQTVVVDGVSGPPQVVAMHCW
jgi:hypothetical protein